MAKNQVDRRRPGGPAEATRGARALQAALGSRKEPRHPSPRRFGHARRRRPNTHDRPARPGQERRNPRHDAGEREDCMRRTIPIVIALIAAVTMILSGCGSSSTNATGSGGSETGAVVEGGILRIGTINYTDSFNPFHYIETQAYQAMIMIYPQFVQYAYGPDGFTIE